MSINSPTVSQEEIPGFTNEFANEFTFHLVCRSTSCLADDICEGKRQVVEDLAQLHYPCRGTVARVRVHEGRLTHPFGSSPR